MTDIERRAALLTAAFGGTPDGVWTAPGRVNLIGEHTDYNDGFVLPTAIDRETLAAARLREDGLFLCRSLDLPGVTTVPVGSLGPGAATGWAAYVVGVAWALREAGVAVGGMDIVVASDVPVGGGLSSSAALETATALAIHELAGGTLTRKELAVACRRAETEVVGAPVGVMDQIAALLGVAGDALLLDCRSLEVQAVPLHLAEEGLRLLVVDTKVSHSNSGGEYGERRRACEQAAIALGVPALRDATLEQVERTLSGTELRCARHVVTENARVGATVDALARHDLAAVGTLFAASHASMRDDFRISCPELDLAVEATLVGGAAAARMTGGGFGGCAVALVPDDLVAGLADGVREAFAAHAFRRPDVFTVEPSDGARRLS